MQCSAGDDPVVDVAWQHCGRGFRCRAVFDSGFVSGMSEPLEAQGVLDNGSYESPAGDGWTLLVGASTIEAFAEITSRQYRRDVLAIIMKFLAKDFLGRTCLLCRSNGEGELGPKLEFRKPTILDETWSGDRLDF